MDSKWHEKPSILEGTTGLRGIWGIYGLGNDGPDRVPVEKRRFQPPLISNVDPRIEESLRHGLFYLTGLLELADKSSL
jgi:hypothetical protein